MTRPAAGLVPVLAVPDPADAALVFEAVNALYAAETEPGERRDRLATLLIAAHAETRNNR